MFGARARAAASGASSPRPVVRLPGVLARRTHPVAEFGYDPAHGEVYNCRERRFAAAIGPRPRAGCTPAGPPRGRADRAAVAGAARRSPTLVEAAAEFAPRRPGAPTQHAETLWSTRPTSSTPSRRRSGTTCSAASTRRCARRPARSRARRVDRSPGGAGGVNGTRWSADRERIRRRCSASTASSSTPATRCGRATDSPRGGRRAAGLVDDLDRLAEDLEIYTSGEFGCVDARRRPHPLAMLMPQKRNPYALAMVRGEAGVIIGRATGILAVTKSPSARSDNLIFAYGEVPRALDLALRITRLIAGVVPGCGQRRPDGRGARAGFTQAADLAEHLVQTARRRLPQRLRRGRRGRAARPRPRSAGGRPHGEKLDDAAAEAGIDRGVGAGLDLDLAAVLDPGRDRARRGTPGGARQPGVVQAWLGRVRGERPADARPRRDRERGGAGTPRDRSGAVRRTRRRREQRMEEVDRWISATSTPTSASWIALIEGSLADPDSEPIETSDPIRRRDRLRRDLRRRRRGRAVRRVVPAAMGGRALIVDRWPFLGGSAAPTRRACRTTCSPRPPRSSTARAGSPTSCSSRNSTRRGRASWSRRAVPRRARHAHAFMNWQTKDQLDVEYVLNARGDDRRREHRAAAGRTFRAQNLVLGLGARPEAAGHPGHASCGRHRLASTLVEELDFEPTRCVVVGGGKVAIEYGSFFQATGCETTMSRARRSCARVRCTTSTRTCAATSSTGCARAAWRSLEGAEPVAVEGRRRPGRPRDVEHGGGRGVDGRRATSSSSALGEQPNRRPAATRWASRWPPRGDPRGQAHATRASGRLRRRRRDRRADGDVQGAQVRHDRGAQHHGRGPRVRLQRVPGLPAHDLRGHLGRAHRGRGARALRRRRSVIQMPPYVEGLDTATSAAVRGGHDALRVREAGAVGLAEARHRRGPAAVLGVPPRRRTGPRTPSSTSTTCCAGPRA